MERYQELREKALKSIHVADHMLTMSYPMLNDPKILVSVANNLLQASDYALSSLLEHEKLFKKINNIPNTIEGRYVVFRDQVAKRFNVNEKHLKLMKDLIEVVNAHKASAVEFPKNDKFVMCSDSYEVRTLSVQELKEYIVKVKGLVEEFYGMTQKNDGLFR